MNEREFELVCFEDAVQHFTHYSTEILFKKQSKQLNHKSCLVRLFVYVPIKIWINYSSNRQHYRRFFFLFFLFFSYFFSFFFFECLFSINTSFPEIITLSSITKSQTTIYTISIRRWLVIKRSLEAISSKNITISLDIPTQFHLWLQRCCNFPLGWLVGCFYGKSVIFASNTEVSNNK